MSLSSVDFQKICVTILGARQASWDIYPESQIIAWLTSALAEMLSLTIVTLLSFFLQWSDQIIHFLLGLMLRRLIQHSSLQKLLRSYHRSKIQSPYPENCHVCSNVRKAELHSFWSDIFDCFSEDYCSTT